jgi:hypothetical protein
MWQYFSSDLAFDLVKGLVVGGASLAFQAVAPTMLRALREVRARYAARKAAREQSGAVSPALQAAASAMLRAVRKVRVRWAARKAARKQ